MVFAQDSQRKNHITSKELGTVKIEDYGAIGARAPHFVQFAMTG